MRLSPRRLLVTAVLTVAVGLGATSVASAQDTVIPFTNWNVGGSLTIAKLGQSATLPPGGTFNGSADLTTGTLSGDVSIPQFTTQLSVLGVPVDATLQFVEAKPVSGTVSVSGSNATINATATAYVKLTRLASPFLPILNLVTNGCQTSQPVVLPLNTTAPLSQVLSSGLTFSGTTTIPLLQGCGLATPLLDALMSGPNNPFTVTLTPPSSSS